MVNIETILCCLKTYCCGSANATCSVCIIAGKATGYQCLRISIIYIQNWRDAPFREEASCTYSEIWLTIDCTEVHCIRGIVTVDDSIYKLGTSEIAVNIIKRILIIAGEQCSITEFVTHKHHTREVIRRLAPISGHPVYSNHSGDSSLDEVTGNAIGNRPAQNHVITGNTGNALPWSKNSGILGNISTHRETGAKI